MLWFGLSRVFVADSLLGGSPGRSKAGTEGSIMEYQKDSTGNDGSSGNKRKLAKAGWGGAIPRGLDGSRQGGRPLVCDFLNYSGKVRKT